MYLNERLDDFEQFAPQDHYVFSLPGRIHLFPVIFQCAHVGILKNDVASVVLCKSAITTDKIWYRLARLAQPSVSVDFCIVIVCRSRRIARGSSMDSSVDVKR